MKIVKIKKKGGKHTKLLNLNILETNYYKKNYLNHELNKNIEYKLKNALNIIFKFHSENKKILFLGTPLQLNKQLKKLLKNTNHLIIPEKIWFSGVLTNTKSIFRFLFKKYLKKNKNTLKFLFNLTVKNDLVVILNESLSQNPLKEFSKKRIPTISLNYNNINLNYPNSTYQIKQNINNFNENKNINNLFFSILTTTFKKAEKVRQKNINSRLKKRVNKKRQFIKKNEFKKKKQI